MQIQNEIYKYKEKANANVKAKTNTNVNIARGTTDPEIDSVTKFSNYMAHLHYFKFGNHELQSWHQMTLLALGPNLTTKWLVTNFTTRWH